MGRRDWLPGEVERVAVPVHDDLDGVGIAILFFALDSPGQIHTLDGRVFKRSYRVIDHGGYDHGFIALHHDDDIGVDLFGRFGYTVACALVRVRRHDRLTPEGFNSVSDLLVAGCDVHVFKSIAERGPMIRVLDHGPPQYRCDRLPGKP